MARYNSQGWHRDSIGTQEYVNTLPRAWGDQLDALPYEQGKSAFPYRHLFRALAGSKHVRGGRLRSLNQGNFGSCVGFATGRACDVVAACDIYQRGQAETWPLGADDKPVVSAPD